MNSLPMNHDIFSVGEIAITQGMDYPDDDGVEVEILGPMQFKGKMLHRATGAAQGPAWRYPTQWPGDSSPGPTYIRYYNLRKKAPPFKQVAGIETQEVGA